MQAGQERLTFLLEAAHCGVFLAAGLIAFATIFGKLELCHVDLYSLDLLR